MDFHELASGLIESPSKIRGYLSEANLQKAMTLVKSNPAFSPRDKRTLTGDLKLPLF